MNESMKAIIAETLKLPVEDIGPETGSANTPQWDSLAQVLMISRIQSELGINIPFERMGEIACVQDFIDIEEGR